MIVRLLGLFFILALFSFTRDNNSWKGSWKAVYEEMGGEVLPAEFFQNQVLTLKGKKYKMIAESVDEGMVLHNDSQMDIFGQKGVNKGKHFKAIYKMENDQLTICYDLTGKDYPESFSTKDQPTYFLARFVRITDK